MQTMRRNNAAATSMPLHRGAHTTHDCRDRVSDALSAGFAPSGSEPIAIVRVHRSARSQMWGNFCARSGPDRTDTAPAHISGGYGTTTTAHASAGQTPPATRRSRRTRLRRCPRTPLPLTSQRRPRRRSVGTARRATSSPSRGPATRTRIADAVHPQLSVS
jgi:hypothetical protein